MDIEDGISCINTSIKRRIEMLVYKITNTINDKIYVGMTGTTLAERYKWHVRDCNAGKSKKLYDAMRELGIENFSVELLETYTTEDELREGEEYYIDYYDGYVNGYNASPNSYGILNHSEETKRKMSESAKKRPPETQETLRKRSESCRQTWKNKSKEELKAWGELSVKNNTGRKHSEEFKQKRKEIMTGVKRSDETKRKMSEQRLGKKKRTQICPHCGKVGRGGAMKQWHFDRCKEK